ncbi:response regulator [candidate division CSSED10-310 bacterium]|uniref:Response regulator n=1 Tax=candidate division CSSED10-310 bacterium TaxID=2855610 RepID=A0ABV6YTT8_UNCC1
MSPSKRKIIIVDDEPIIRISLELVLRKHGYEVNSFKNAELILPLIPKNDAHLFIIDLELPGINGQELAQKIIEQKPASKIIFLTGFDLSESQLNPDISNVYRLMHKPVDIDQLLHSIREAMETEQ